MEVPDGSAVDELWENQSYVPIKGWGGPYALMNRFTDASGSICYSDNDFPDVALQEGWMWTTEWTVDTTSAFATDDSGWAYGLTWDRLFEAIQHNLCTADSAATLVRRRKWIRGRVCVTSDAMDQLHKERDAVISQHNTIKTMIQNKCTDYEQILSLHNKYTADTSSCLAQLDNHLKLISTVTAQMMSHLEELLIFLDDMIIIEKEYISKLTHLSHKHQQRHANDTPLDVPAMVSPQAAVAAAAPNNDIIQDEAEDEFVEVPQESSFVDEVRDVSDVPPSTPIAAQFYNTLHKTNTALTMQINDYITLLATITTDIRDQLIRLKEQHKRVKTVTALRENIAASETTFKKSYQTFCLQHTHTTSVLSSSLDAFSSHIDANFTTAKPVLPNLTAPDPYVAYCQYLTSLSAHKAQIETFLSAVAIAVSHQQPLASQYQFIYITTLQLLSHEKNRIFVENTETLQEMAKEVASAASSQLSDKVDAAWHLDMAPLASSDLSDVLCSVPCVAIYLDQVLVDLTSSISVTAFGMMHIHSPSQTINSFALKGSEVRDVSESKGDISKPVTLQIRLAQPTSLSLLGASRKSEVTLSFASADANLLLLALSDALIGAILVDITIPTTKKSRRRSSAGTTRNSNNNSDCVMKKSDDALMLAQQAMLLAEGENDGACVETDTSTDSREV